MTATRAPRTVDQATELLKRYAAIEGDIATIEGERAAALASANAVADDRARPLLEERAAIAEKLQPWWAKNGAGLTQGKRKSLELGGCMIGSKAGRASLAIAGDEAAIAALLRKRKWAADLLRVTVSLDKGALLRAIGGTYKKQLAALGLGRREGVETFFIERVQQAGTLAGAE